MTELHYIYQRLREKADFLCRVVPLVLEDCKIDEWRVRLAARQVLEAGIRGNEPNARDLGVEDFRLYRMVRRWHSDIGDILVFIARMLSPRGFGAIFVDDSHALRTMRHRAYARSMIRYSGKGRLIGSSNNPRPHPFQLNEVRGKLFKVPKARPAEIIADRRGGWDGWLELHRHNVNHVAIENTARASSRR